MTTRSPGIRRERAGRAFATSRPDGAVRDAASWRASARSPSRRRGPTCGSARTPTATSRPPAATRAAASSTATTPRWREVRDETKFERMIDVRATRCPSIRRRVDARPAPGRAAAREGARRGRAAARDAPHPRRQRGVRARTNQLVRPDDAARPPRRRSTAATRPLPVPRQERQGARGRASTTAGWRASSALPGAARPGAVPVRRRRRQPSARRLGRRERVPARDHRRRFTAKDFRTWAGTVLRAARARRARAGASTTPTAKQAHVVAAVEGGRRAARQHAAVCRKCYIHPAVIEAFESGAFLERLATLAKEPSGRRPRCRRAHDARLSAPRPAARRLIR